MIESIQHSSDIDTTETPTPASILGYATSSTLINRGTSLVSDDAKVAKKSTCQFYPLAS